MDRHPAHQSLAPGFAPMSLREGCSPWSIDSCNDGRRRAKSFGYELLQCRVPMKGLDAGKPVLTEKPLGRHLQQIDDCFNKAKACSQPLFVGFQRRFDPAFSSLVQAVRAGDVGQLQFVRGAYASPGGKSFICLASTFERHGVRKSRIVLDLTPGNVVTTPRSDMMYVVTEYGIVNLKGQSVADRAKALIAIAHPDYRESLEREARDNALIPKNYF